MCKISSLALFAWAVACVGGLWGGANAGPLSDYVFRADPHYKYDILQTIRGVDYTHYVVNMTSQKWKTEEVSSQPIWWHYLSVTVPDKLIFKDSAFLFIDGGSNHHPPPNVTDNFVALTIMTAVSTGMIGGNLKMIPNEPITFSADPTHKSRGEDAIIAWTWKTYVHSNQSDPEFLLRFPMTKASVRALDTMADIAVEKKHSTKVDKFYVAGASKRGWTTWTTAAVDPRVKGIAPIVMDLLNMVKNIHHHYRAYGGWTFAFKDYYDLNFTASLDDIGTQKMAELIDPLVYNDTLKIPKMIISTGGDEFFLPDDSHYYFDQLVGPKYLRILPNAEHSCAGHEIGLFFAMKSFFLSIATNTTLPTFTWKREMTETGGRITIFSDVTPLTVHSYYAHTLDGLRRDFRLVVKGPDGKPYPHPVIWNSHKVDHLGDNSYKVEFDTPRVGWLAFFIQVTFRGYEDSILEFTTETQIIPDTFPFPDCAGPSCRGTLV